MLASRLAPGRCPPSHPADPWLFGPWSRVRRDFDCRPPPSVWVLTAGQGGALCLPEG